MKITVIGASAGVGLAVVNLALALGHQVTSLSRSVASLPVHLPALRVIRGSSTVEADVATAVAGAEAILVTLGTGLDTKPTTLYSQSARVLVDVLRQRQCATPVIVLTGFGAGDSGPYNSPLMRLLFRLFLKAVYADKSAMETLIAEQLPAWCMVRPGRLTNAPGKGRYRVQPTLAKGMRVSSIAREDVAEFMVKQAEHPTYLGQYPALSD